MILYFTYESRDTLKSFSFVSQCPNYNETESGTRRNIRNKSNKISPRGSRSTDNAEFGHFTLLVCRGQQRNVPRIVTQVLSHCSAH